MTTLEARVAEASWTALRAAFASAAGGAEPGLVRSYLVQASAERERWRIVTIWRDREALAAMRGAGTPRGVVIFRAAGAEPDLLIADIADCIEGAG